MLWSVLGSLLGHRLLYYAAISHWFRFRLWSPDWNVVKLGRIFVCPLDGDPSLKWAQYHSGNHPSRDLDPDANQCENFCIVQCTHQVWNPSLNLSPNRSPAMSISHYELLQVSRGNRKKNISLFTRTDQPLSILINFNLTAKKRTPFFKYTF